MIIIVFNLNFLLFIGMVLAILRFIEEGLVQALSKNPDR